MLPLFHQSSGVVQSSVDQVFAHLDDHSRLSSHMSKPSWRMGWGRMTTEVDEGRGQEVGSQIRLSGQMLGLRIAVNEVVVERLPPNRKVWETTGEPRLVVMGHYLMGFELLPGAQGSILRVFIEYRLPKRGISRWLGRLFGRYYAGWCTQQMVDGGARRRASR